jgi:hypothetical protein
VTCDEAAFDAARAEWETAAAARAGAVARARAARDDYAAAVPTAAPFQRRLGEMDAWLAARDRPREP